MSDFNPRTQPAKGWVLYDGECGFCSRWLRFWQPTLAKRGFDSVALARAWGDETATTASRRDSVRHSLAHSRRPAGFRSRCLFASDQTNLVGLAVLCRFQPSRI